MRQSLGPEETLQRGFVIVRGSGDSVVTSPDAAAEMPRLELQFAGSRRVTVRPEGPEKPKRRKPAPPEQKTLI